MMTRDKKNDFNKIRLLSLILLSVFVLMPATSEAQGMGELFGSSKQKKKSKSDTEPTKISALAVDLDFQNNVVTLMGDVKVNNPERKIDCDKMVLYLSDKDNADAIAAAAKVKVPILEGRLIAAKNIAKVVQIIGQEKDQIRSERALCTQLKMTPEQAKNTTQMTLLQFVELSDAQRNRDFCARTEAELKQCRNLTLPSKRIEKESSSDETGKSVKRIECYGHVVIIQLPGPDEKATKEMRAEGDKAVYDLTKETMELFGGPEYGPAKVTQEGKTMIGRKMIIYPKEGNRIKITDGVFTGAIKDMAQE